MKTKNIYYIMLLLGTALFTCCSYNELEDGDYVSDKIQTTQKPTEVTMTVTPSSFVFGYEGGSKVLNISYNGDWSIPAAVDWCHPSVLEGRGEVTVDITCDANTTNVEREGIILIKYANGTKTVEVTVKQDPNEYFVSTSIQNLEFDGQGETKNFQLLSNTEWNISSNRSWCQVSPLTGNGNQDITIVIGGNPTKSSRTAVLTITSTTPGITPVEIQVTQDPGEEVQQPEDNTIGSVSIGFSSVFTPDVLELVTPVVKYRDKDGEHEVRVTKDICLYEVDDIDLGDEIWQYKRYTWKPDIVCDMFADKDLDETISVRYESNNATIDKGREYELRVRNGVNHIDSHFSYLGASHNGTSIYIPVTLEITIGDGQKHDDGIYTDESVQMYVDELVKIQQDFHVEVEREGVVKLNGE